MSREGDLGFMEVVRNRRTLKVMNENPQPISHRREPIERLLRHAGWAPFHRPCHAVHQTGPLQGIEPWRMYALDATACRTLRMRILNEEGAGKIPSMLATADALIQVTWLPDPPSLHPLSGPHLFEPTMENMEHIAAAAAAIQNLILLATNQGIPNYWSSGGILRSPNLFKWLGIPPHEILLGAIFLFPEIHEQSTEVGSKLREKRTDAPNWMTWVNLDSPS